MLAGMGREARAAFFATVHVEHFRFGLFAHLLAAMGEVLANFENHAFFGDA